MKTASMAAGKWRAKTLAVSGLLGAISIVLGVTPLGFIPVPTPAGHATIMHVPAILGGVLEGPTTGALVGLIFGLYSFMQASNALFADPIIALLPRILIGLIAYGTYRFTKSDVLAAALGTITNTAGVLGLAVLRGYITGPVAWGIALTQGVPEVFVAIIVTVMVSKTVRKIRR